MRLSDWNQKLPRGVDLRLLCIAAICCFAVWSFVELADDAPEGDYIKLENSILQALRDPESPEQPIGPFWLENAALDLTALGGLPVLILMTALVSIRLLLLRRVRTTLFLIASTVSGGLLTFYLKAVFARDRPDVVPQLAEVSTLSFPSGHAMTSSIVYLTLGVILARAAASRRERIYYIAAAFFLTFIIGLTRVYLGVHYPTDVLAGWAGGTAWALLSAAIVYWLQNRGKISRSR